MPTRRMQSKPTPRRSTAPSPRTSPGPDAPQREQNPAPDVFDLGEPELFVRAFRAVPVSVAASKLEGGKAILIQGALHDAPFQSLQPVWKVIWMIVAGALGVNREQVIHLAAAQVDQGELMPCARYWIKEDLAETLASPSVVSKINVAMAMLMDSFLWVTGQLASRYEGQPWDDMEELVQEARDQISASKLPCVIEISFRRNEQRISLGPELSPPRPSSETRRDERLIGTCVGYLFSKCYLMYFAVKQGHEAIDIAFAPSDERIDEILRVAGKFPPIIEVEFESVLHDGVVKERLLKSIRKIGDSLFGDR